MSDGQRDNTEEGLRMDEDSSISRVERTFWTVWSYITGAVNRFFRPEPTNVTGNDQNSIQDSAVDSEPANCGHAEGDTSGGGVDEEQPVATAALLSSSRPVVAWELCATEINLGPDEETMPCETQLSRGNESEASEEGKGSREEQLGQAGNDDAGLFFAQDDKREENGDEKLHTHRQDEMPENGETEEHANVRSLKTTGDAVSEDMEESRRGAEDTERAVTLDETIHVKEAEDKMHHEDEQDLQAEDSEVKLCLTADLTAVEEDNMHVEEAKMQQNEADTAVMHEEVGNTDGVPQLASESESDEGARQVEHQLSACEESSDDHRDFKEDPGFSPLHVELQMTYDKSSIVSEDELTAVEQQHVTARRSESDEVGDMKEEMDGSTLDVSEAANNQTMDEAPEQEDDIKTLAGVIVPEHVTYREKAMQHSPEQEEVVTHSEEFVQNAPEEEDDIKTVTEDMLSEHVTFSEEAMQNALQMEEEIKTVTEDIITEHVLSSGGFVQNAPEREDNITTVTDDTLTEQVKCSEEFVQYLLEQEDDSLTEHVTGSEQFMQNAPELEEEIKTVTEDIITEVVKSSCEFVQNALEQEDDIETVTEGDSLTEHATCSAEAMQNAPEQEDNITTVTDDTLTEHVRRSEEFVQYLLEQEDDSLTEHVTGSEEFVQNAPELEEEIKTIAEDIITEHVISSCEFMQNAPEQEDNITTVTDDTLTEHVRRSEEFVQYLLEQEDDSLTEHVTGSEEFVQNAPELEEEIKTVAEDIITEHVISSCEFVQNAPEQEDDIKTVTDDTLTEHVTRSKEFVQYLLEQEDNILTEHVTGSEEFVHNAPEQEEEIKTVTEGDSLTEHATCSAEFMQNVPEQEDDIKTVTDGTLTEHVTRSEESVQYLLEQEDDILTEHVTGSKEFVQNAPELEEEIKTVAEDIITEHVISSCESVQNAPEQEDDIKTVTDGTLTEHVTHSEESVQYLLEQEDDILTEYVTGSKEFVQNAPELEEEIKTVTEDIITEHVISSGKFVQNAPEQEDDIETVTKDILTEHVTCSEEVTQNAPEQDDDIKTVSEENILTAYVTCSEEVTQNAPEQEDHILTEHVTRSKEVTQNAPDQDTCSKDAMQNSLDQDDDIKKVSEDILTEHVTCSHEFMQNVPEQEDNIKAVTEHILTEHITYGEDVMQHSPEQEDDIKAVTEDVIIEHVTCSEEFVQHAPEQEDDIIIEHVTCSEEVMHHSPEQEDDIKAVTEDIIIEHVTCSREFVQHAPEQENDIITGHVTCSEEVTHHSPEQEDDIETLTADVLTEHVTCSDDITQNAPEQDDIETATEDDILTEHVTHSEEFMQNAESELHTSDFADVEQEDVAEDTEVRTKTREADDVETESHGSLIDTNSDITTHTSEDESYFAQVEEESLSSEAVNKESDVEIARTATSIMDKPDGETGQEMSGEFKNIPQSMCEGRVVVSEELNSPTCGETREGVPEYNNEPDENTTQRFLEDGGYEEIQGSPLPEEVESKEPESLQNSGCLLVREHMGEEQGVKNSFDSVVGDHAEILRLADAGMPQETETPLVEAVIQGSGRLVEVEDGELLVDSMKAGIEEKTEEESESDVESTNKDDKATEEPRDGTEELLVDLENDEGLCDSKIAVAAGVGWETTGALAAQEVLEDDTLPEAEVQKTTETSYFQGLVDAMNSSLLDDITQSEFLKHSNETESVLLEDVGIQDAGLEAEETGYAVEVEAAADEMQGRNEMEIFHLQATEMAESELRGPVESLKTKNQPSDEVLEISSVEMLPEAAGESKTAQSEPQDLILISTEDTTKHVTESEGSHAEETVSSISGRMDVINEEILDLWMQTASSEDNDGIQRQEGPEPGQQTEPSNEEEGEISSAKTEKDEEQLVDLVSDAEMSSSTVESGFLDQSLGEWGTQSNETQQPKSTSTESFQGIHDLLANMSESADISQSSAQHSGFLMEKTAETDLKQEESITATGVHPEKGDLNQESDKSQEETEEERVEAVETETGSQKEIGAEEAELAEKTDWKDTEEADVQSEKTQAEDEPLERSDSPDEIKHTESERSGSSSEASLEEGVVLTESGSQDDTCTESEKLSTLPSLDEPQPRQSEDIAESEAGAEVAEQLTTKSEDEMEVDTFVLDFSVQRSRIAVKNPRVRPPKDPRSLLHMPSLDPTPSVPRPSKVPIGVPLGGMGIGIKLPGLGAGFPVLKKTQRVVRDENKPETPSEETKPEEKSDTPKQDEAPHRPKWMPPKHPGFGNPLMSELKSKLKKTTKE